MPTYGTVKAGILKNKFATHQQLKANATATAEPVVAVEVKPPVVKAAPKVEAPTPVATPVVEATAEPVADAVVEKTTDVVVEEVEKKSTRGAK